MPHVVRWADQAMDGLERVHSFLAELDAQVALQALDTIYAGAETLGQFPNAGRPANDLEPEHQELLISFGASGYALFYEVIGEAVVILAVKHQKESGY